MASQALPKKVQNRGADAIQPSMAYRPRLARMMQRLRQGIQNAFWPEVHPLTIAAANYRGGIKDQVTIRDQDDCFEVQANTPGLGAESLEVLVNHHYMTLRSLPRQVSATPPSKAGLKASMSGPCSGQAVAGSGIHAMIPLPEGTDRDKIEATYKNGLLVVRIPKKPHGVARKIPVILA